MRFSALIPFLAISACSSVVAAGFNSNNSIRVRKEWRDLKDREKKDFLDAVKCLGKKPHGELTLSGAIPDIPTYNKNSSLYDDLVYAHIDLNFEVHLTALFLAWHRWFILTFEKKLREQCSFTGALPFWDWSKDVSGGIPNSPVFSSSRLYGFGSLPLDSANTNVTDGAFWNVVRAYPEPHIVNRLYDIYPYRGDPFPFPIKDPDVSAPSLLTREKVDKLVKGSAGNYTDFQYMMDGFNFQGMHGAAHAVVGGDMVDLFWSPNDPVFWLHHAHIDCIWARWQAYRPENAMAFGGGLTQNFTYYDQHPVGSDPPASLNSELPTAGLDGPKKVYVRDMMSTTGGGLRYKCSY